MEAFTKNIRLQRAILIIAVVLFITKLFAYYITGSLAILTDALESTVNIIAGGIGLFSLLISAKPKDTDHPYGHGKAEFLSATLEGTLIIASGLVILYKSVESFFTGHHVTKIDFGILLISITAVINFIAGKMCLKTGKKNDSLQLIASGKHLVTDAYSTLAIVGGLIMIHITHLAYLDGLVAIVFSIIILYNGYKIVSTSVGGIMDKADFKLLKNIVNELNEKRPENWIDLHNLRVIRYGNTLHCDCHLTVPWYLNIREAHSEIEALAELIKKKYGESVELFVHSDGCMDFSCKICFKKDCMVRKHLFEKKIEWTLENVLKDSRHHV